MQIYLKNQPKIFKSFIHQFSLIITKIYFADKLSLTRLFMLILGKNDIAVLFFVLIFCY